MIGSLSEMFSREVEIFNGRDDEYVHGVLLRISFMSTSNGLNMLLQEKKEYHYDIISSFHEVATCTC